MPIHAKAVLTIFDPENPQRLRALLDDDVQYSAYAPETCPTTGKLHWQAFIVYKQNKSIASIQKKFNGCNVLKMSDKATLLDNEIYCSKQGKLIEHGTKPLTNLEKGDVEKNRWKKIRELAEEGNFKEIEDDFYVHNAKTVHFIHEQAEKKRKYNIENLECAIRTPYKWQQEILDIIKTPTNKRHIYFIVDEKGESGKTELIKYILKNNDAWSCTGGDFKDLAYLWNPKEIALINIVRTGMQIPYAFLECLKDGMITSTKYETINKYFKCPHIFVFTNMMPDMTAMSKDRYKIIIL